MALVDPSCPSHTTVWHPCLKRKRDITWRIINTTATNTLRLKASKAYQRRKAKQLKQLEKAGWEKQSANKRPSCFARVTCRVDWHKTKKQVEPHSSRLGISREALLPSAPSTPCHLLICRLGAYEPSQYWMLNNHTLWKTQSARIWTLLTDHNRLHAPTAPTTVSISIMIIP